MRLHMPEKLQHLIRAMKHPPIERVTRIVLVTHIIYYGSAVIGPLFLPVSIIHYCTSGACFVALLAELVARK